MLLKSLFWTEILVFCMNFINVLENWENEKYAPVSGAGNDWREARSAAAVVSTHVAYQRLTWEWTFESYSTLISIKYNCHLGSQDKAISDAFWTLEHLKFNFTFKIHICSDRGFTMSSQGSIKHQRRRREHFQGQDYQLGLRCLASVLHPSLLVIWCMITSSQCVPGSVSKHWR